MTAVKRGNTAAPQLRSYIERIERLEEERKQLTDDVRDIFAEAKGDGFDVKAMREVIRYRKQDRMLALSTRRLWERYVAALGELADTPLGQCAAALAEDIRPKI